MLFPTSYLPPIHWFADAFYEESILLEVQETFPKQTIRNRCVIASASGALNLIIPVSKPNGSHTITSDILVDYSKSWQKNHWRSIVAAYNKSPFFLYYRDEFERLFNLKHQSLVNLNHDFISLVFKLLKLNKELNYTTEYPKDEFLAGRLKLFSDKKADSSWQNYNQPRYIQVFEPKNGFLPGLSILDLLFNLGPDSLAYLKSLHALRANL